MVSSRITALGRCLMFGFSNEGHLRFLTDSIEISLQNKKLPSENLRILQSHVEIHTVGGLAGAVEKGEGGSVGGEEQAWPRRRGGQLTCLNLRRFGHVCACEAGAQS